MVHAFGAALVNNALGVAENNVLVLHAQPHIMFGGGNARGAGAIENHAHAADIFADNLQRIQQRGSGDDRRAMLVVVEDRNLHGLAQSLLDVETLRGLDVFEIDSAESGFEQLADFDDLIGIVGVDFDVEDIHVGEALEQDGFPFHDRLARQRADIASPSTAVPLVTTATRLPRPVYLKALWGFFSIARQGWPRRAYRPG